MSKSAGVVLFQRGDESESENSDIWDDDLLTKAYDKAVKVTQDEIAKRIAMSTNNIPKNTTKHATTATQNGHAGKSKSKCKKKQTSISSAHSWAPGAPCRATYHSDGLEYEADVVHVLDEDLYLIRFIGYDNEQKVHGSELRASLGDQQRYDQIKEAAVNSLQEHTSDMDCDNDAPASALGNLKRNGPQKSKSKHKKSICGQSGSGYDPLKLFGHIPGAAVAGGIPFPVFPGSVLEGAPAMPPLPFASDTQHELQALNSMLVSWYMSGYYTGMYHGMKKAEKKNTQ